MHRAIMIDLETLDVQPSAHILSIGACLMHDMDRTFYKVLGTKEQSRSISTSTIDWWVQQNQAAQDEVLIEIDVNLKETLEEFTDYIKGSGATSFWSHGDDFDLVILSHAYHQLGMPVPWSFWNTRDTRTLIEVSKRILGRDYEPDRQGTYHNAGDDALHQARWINRLWEELEKLRK